MIQKMPTDNSVCKICKDIALAIPRLEGIIAGAQKQHDNAKNPDPVLRKQFKDGMQDQIAWHSAHLQGLKEAYKAILGVEYGSEQTHEVYKPSMNEYVFCTLHQRGITKVRYEDIEPRNGSPYVRIHWTEKIE